MTSERGISRRCVPPPRRAQAQVRRDPLRLLKHHVGHVHHPLLRHVLHRLRPPPHPCRLPLHPVRLLPQDAPTAGRRARGRAAAGGRGRVGREGERGHTADEEGRGEEELPARRRRRRAGVAGEAEPERTDESHCIDRYRQTRLLFIHSGQLYMDMLVMEVEREDNAFKQIQTLKSFQQHGGTPNLHEQKQFRQSTFASADSRVNQL